MDEGLAQRGHRSCMQEGRESASQVPAQGRSAEWKAKILQWTSLHLERCLRQYREGSGHEIDEFRFFEMYIGGFLVRLCVQGRPGGIRPRDIKLNTHE